MKKKLILSAAVAVLLVVGAYAYTINSKMNIDALRQQCKAELKGWNSNEDIPESCSSHLKMLTEKHGIGEDEPNSEFRERIKSSDDFQLQMAVQDKLSDVCQLQVGEPWEKLATAQCLRAMSHHKEIGLRTNIPVSIPIPIDPIVNVGNQCEQDFSSWESGQDIPQSCYNHLDALLAGSGIKEDEAFYEYAYRIKHDDRFNIHFEIKRQLSDICYRNRRINKVVPECEVIMEYTKKMYFLSDDLERAYGLALSDNMAPTPIENETGTYCYLELIRRRVTDPLPSCVEHEIKVLGGNVQDTKYPVDGISNEDVRTLSVLETLCSLQPLGRDQDLVTVPASCGAKNNYAVHIGAIDLNAKGEQLPKPEELTP